jgi:SOS response regulatory protein OraA/RecX
MLAQRELSESQLRQRLARRKHDAADIDAAIQRLKEERAVDDTRAAEAIARREATGKHRGRIRVRAAIERSGVAPAIARRVVNELFASVDDGELVEAALKKRLRGREGIENDQEFQRLYRYLLGQGFDADLVLKTLGARRRRV